MAHSVLLCAPVVLFADISIVQPVSGNTLAFTPGGPERQVLGALDLLLISMEN